MKVIYVIGLFILGLFPILATEESKKTGLKEYSLELKKGVTQNKSDENSELATGTKLADFILKQCPIAVGKITNITSLDNMEKTILDFRVDEWITINNGTNVNEFKLYYSPPALKNGYITNISDNLKLINGTKLLIGNCPNSNQLTTSFISSDEKNFQAIINVINYNASVEKNNGKFFNVSQILNSQNDKIFIGYLLQRIWRFGTINANDNALILTELIGTSMVPKNSWDVISGQLDYLIKGNNVLSEETQKLVINKFIYLGISDNLEESIIGLKFLITLVEDNQFNVNSLINADIRKKLLQNYQNLPTDRNLTKGKAFFEKQLRGY